jgi:hypothetical protein
MLWKKLFLKGVTVPVHSALASLGYFGFVPFRLAFRVKISVRFNLPGSLEYPRLVHPHPYFQRKLTMTEESGGAPGAFAIGRPQPDEYAPYYDRYISLIADTDILETLDEQRRQTVMMLSGRGEADGDFRYAPGKWSAKEVLGHVCDTERVFAYRALRISRNDSKPMEGFEQDDYVRYGPFAQRPLGDLIEDYIAVRRSTLSLLRNLEEAAWRRRGIANGGEVSVRGVAYIIAGHELHHRRILEEKYFGR